MLPVTDDPVAIMIISSPSIKKNNRFLIDNRNKLQSLMEYVDKFPEPIVQYGSVEFQYNFDGMNYRRAIAELSYQQYDEFLHYADGVLGGQKIF